MLNISCPVCNCSGGRALGITNVIIKCRKCGTYYLYHSDDEGKSVIQIIKDKEKDQVKDIYK